MPLHFGALRDVQEFYDVAGKRFASGLGGLMNFGTALGKRARFELTKPREVELQPQDRRALSFQKPSSGIIRPGNQQFVRGQVSLESQIKDIKRRIIRRKRLKKRIARPARRLGR